MREARVARKTAETDIEIRLTWGLGASTVDTGCGFLDHMLTLFAFHGRFDLTARCAGDAKVDFHHTVEDTALSLGRAFSDALGDRAGIARYGSFLLPMDEALVMCALDISGRAHLSYDLAPPAQKIGEFDTGLGASSFWVFVGAELTAYLTQLSGHNSHTSWRRPQGLWPAMRQAVAST
jgi:imidazoleglycerol-phosphate dehydratase